MRVGVGSGNPVKATATERALAGRDATVEAVPVESGVSEQPRGRAETVEGAENRARRALAAGEFDLGVGIEGGVATLSGVGGRFLIMWAAVTDGDRTGRGGGPSLRLPDDIAARVDAGEELGPVMDDVLDREGVAREGGAAGALTDGAVDREAALSSAVAGALGPFVADLY
ncbi:DUF84 family protein [Halostella litorea]|uniref:DUF84 family protein n=1 Tax=Halostella litorea TaxID=2528831 RepID=UPI00109218C0|nr:inosine/xanthosine triphosphatase [Halostella litorea]